MRSPWKLYSPCRVTDVLHSSLPKSSLLVLVIPIFRSFARGRIGRTIDGVGQGKLDGDPSTTLMLMIIEDGVVSG